MAASEQRACSGLPRSDMARSGVGFALNVTALAVWPITGAVMPPSAPYFHSESARTLHARAFGLSVVGEEQVGSGMWDPCRCARCTAATDGLERRLAGRLRPRGHRISRIDAQRVRVSAAAATHSGRVSARQRPV